MSITRLVGLRLSIRVNFNASKFLIASSKARTKTTFCRSLPIIDASYINPDYVLNRQLYSPLTSSCFRTYSKKKKGSKRQVEYESEDESDEDENEDSEPVLDEHNMVSKSIASLRIDSVLKAGLGITKKKIEKQFYAGNIRQNGEKVIRKATMVSGKDELDIVKSISPDNPNFLVVDRLVMVSIGNVKGSGNIPLTMQVLKSLIIENYADAWKPAAENLQDFDSAKSA